MKHLVLILLCALGSVRAAAPDGASRFSSLGIPVRLGGLMGCLAGPNGNGGESLYFNLNQAGAPLFLVQVDPETGQSRQFNAPEGPGAWGFTIGPDEKVYLGTWSGALILRFDPKAPAKGIEVVGKPSASEDYLWQFATGSDGKLYACTYPNAKLVSFDPRSGQMEDLGRMHPTEMYARSVAAGNDGLIYVGIGMEQGDLVMFDPATKTHRSILPASLRQLKGLGSPSVVRAADGIAYAHYGQWLKLERGVATPVAQAPVLPGIKLRDGRVVAAHSRGAFTLQDPRSGTVVERKFSYAGAGDLIFVVGLGPGGKIYGSTAMPLEVFRYDPRSNRSEHLGNMPGGEVYSMLENQGKLYLCYYGGSIMNLYDPNRNYWRFGSTPDSNPVSFGGIGDGHLRPRAMIYGPDGLIYVGSEPPYGQLGGAIGVWNPALNKTIENYRHVVTNQSIVSLAYDAKTGLLFGGSGNFGGGGTRPKEKEALFFAFDPKKKEKIWETALAAGAAKYSATFARDGLVYTAAGDKLFVLDAATRRLLRTLELPGSQVEISLGQDPSGTLYGLTTKAVYAVNAEATAVTVLGQAPERISCGFALTEEAIYYGSGAKLWRFALRADR